MFDDNSPIFMQIAQTIRNEILRGVYEEGDQVPSTNEFAAFYKINPATAGKGINLLVDEGVLYKRRGIGMFVADGAHQQLKKQRRINFQHTHLRDFIREARTLDIPLSELTDLISEEYDHDQQPEN